MSLSFFIDLFIARLAVITAFELKTLQSQLSCTPIAIEVS